MIEGWLGDVSLSDFWRVHFRRRALARQGSAANAVAACDWEGLGALLAMRPPPDTLVITRGALTDDPIPSSLSALRRLLSRSVGIVVRNAGLGAQFDFSIFARETTPVLCCSLAPGDLLCVPRGCGHVAKPQSDSLSISVGVWRD